MPVENPHRNLTFGEVVIQLYPPTRVEMIKHEAVCIARAMYKERYEIDMIVKENRDNGTVFLKVKEINTRNPARFCYEYLQGEGIDIRPESFLADYEQGIVDYILTQVERKYA